MRSRSETAGPSSNLVEVLVPERSQQRTLYAMEDEASSPKRKKIRAKYASRYVRPFLEVAVC